MKDIIVSLLIIGGILAVCGFYFKAVILNWLSRDAALRALNDVPQATPVVVPSGSPEHTTPH